MSLITRVPEANIWEEICKEFAFKCPPFKDDDEESVHTVLEDFDSSRTNPVFFGKMSSKINVEDTDLDFHAEVSHPACVGHTFLDRPAKPPSPPPPAKPDKKKCTPRQFLENYIFPVLLPAMEEMLRKARKEKCFERKRTKFNALDFLTEFIYKNNPNLKVDREKVELLDISFVQEWLKDHPRPPLPLSLIWTEEEAALKIQSFWRGYLVRKDPEIQELRQWQHEWREENADITRKVSDFWYNKMPEGDKPTPNASEEVLTATDINIAVQQPVKT